MLRLFGHEKSFIVEIKYRSGGSLSQPDRMGGRGTRSGGAAA